MNAIIRTLVNVYEKCMNQIQLRPRLAALKGAKRFDGTIINEAFSLFEINLVDRNNQKLGFRPIKFEVYAGGLSSIIHDRLRT